MKKVTSWIIGLLLPVLISCTENPVVPAELSLDYLSLEEGNVWIYDYLENQYFPTEVLSTTYLVKDSIVSAETIEQGISYSFNRYQQDSGSTQWNLIEVWTVEVSENRVIFQKGNSRTINWVFPPFEDKSWNGYSFMNKPEVIFRMTNIGLPFTSLAGIDTQESALVTQWNNEDYIVELEYRSEVFGKGVGLIESIEKNYIYCQEPSCLGMEVVAEGYDIQYSLKSYALN